MHDAAIHPAESFLINLAPRYDRAARHISAAQCFRERDDVRFEIPMLETKHFTGATQPGLHFIGNQERPVWAAKLLGPLEKIAFGRLTTLALHRLDHECGHITRAQLAIQSL